MINFIDEKIYEFYEISINFKRVYLAKNYSKTFVDILKNERLIY